MIEHPATWAASGNHGLRCALAALRLHRVYAYHELQGDLHGEPFMGNLWRGQIGAWWHSNAPAAFTALMGDADGGRHWALRAPWSDGAWTPAGAMLATRVTLIGPAVEHAQAVVDALEAVGRQGLGPRHGQTGLRTQARLQDLRVETLPGASQVTPSALDVLEHTTAAEAMRHADVAGGSGDLLEVALTRPLRFKVDGTVFVGVPTMEQLLRRTLGRLVQLLPAAEGDRPDSGAGTVDTAGEAEPGDERRRLFDPQEHAAWMAAARDCHCVEHDLRAWHWRRHSRRSHQDMPLEGVTGRLRYQGPRATLLPWLRLADWLQIGSKTTFGFGALEVG